MRYIQRFDAPGLELREGGPTAHVLFDTANYDGLPEGYKAAPEAALKSANVATPTLCDIRNIQAICPLAGKGVTLHPLPRDILDPTCNGN